jgi:peptidoglycan/xylan/chitin deacetylase (PgdA/CDA1 family)
MKALTVLLYHRIGPGVGKGHPELTIAPEDFRAQMDWLSRNKYQTVSIEGLLNRRIARLPERSVMITFDDGYADLADHAFPVLRQHEFHALVFTPTAFIGGYNEWDVRTGSPRHELLRAAQISAWSACGIEFGSHSRSHRDLTTLEGTALAEETATSKSELDKLLKSQVTAFAFPFGRYDDRSLTAIRATYRVAFTTEEGRNDDAADLHLLHRTMVQPTDNMLGFELRVRCGRNPIQRVRASAAKVRRMMRGAVP